MQAVLRLLDQKEAQIWQVRRELEALRLAAALLAEPADAVPAITAPAATATLVKPAEPPVKPAAAPAKPATPPRSGNSNGPVIAGVLRFAREPEARTRTVVDLPPAPVPVHIALFPQPQNGWIVCDACGHRNPDYLIDCEQCDIPIRLRPDR
jgi:hypothetical protein